MVFEASDRPIICQFGGSCAEELLAAALVAQEYDIDAIDINMVPLPLFLSPPHTTFLPSSSSSSVCCFLVTFLSFPRFSIFSPLFSSPADQLFFIGLSSAVRAARLLWCLFAREVR